MHSDIKILVSCDINQSTLGSSSSTILCPKNEVRGWKNCFNCQEAKSLDRLIKILQIKLWKSKLEREWHTISNSGKLWLELKHFGQ